MPGVSGAYWDALGWVLRLCSCGSLLQIKPQGILLWKQSVKTQSSAGAFETLGLSLEAKFPWSPFKYALIVLNDFISVQKCFSLFFQVIFCVSFRGLITQVHLEHSQKFTGVPFQCLSLPFLQPAPEGANQWHLWVSYKWAINNHELLMTGFSKCNYPFSHILCFVHLQCGSLGNALALPTCAFPKGQNPCLCVHLVQQMTDFYQWQLSNIESCHW